jgi:hypothetical protein
MRRLATVLLAASLAFPAVAHAQGGAGDDQYQDPFGNSGGSSGSGSGSSGSGSKDSNMPSLSSAPPAASAPSVTSTATAPSASASTVQGAQLAATGADPVLMALLGAGLLLGGTGLRLRLRVD